MADKQSHPSSLCQCWHQHTHWQQQSTSTVSLHEGIISHKRAGTCVLVLTILPSQQCSVPPEKKGLALLKPTDNAFLTTVYKGPFIPTVPKIAIGCNHEMNTWLWIPLNHCLLTRQETSVQQLHPRLLSLFSIQQSSVDSFCPIQH